MRQAIPAGERLAITLRFLATGESYSSLHYQFRISVPSICQIVPETCQIIYQVLVNDYFHFPENADDWKRIAQGFQEKWQLPNCIGAADGKHIRILHPKNSGSSFYNYKGYYSIVLMAVVDADYNFVFADVGCQGRISDSGVMRNTPFWQMLANNNLNLPKPEPLPLPSTSVFHPKPPIPFYIAGDDAFPLETFVMKPFSQRGLTDERSIFNYRLSRGRRVSENVFGILASRFRMYFTTLSMKPDNAVKIILASLVLHNLLRTKASGRYIPTGSVDSEDENGRIREGAWRSEEVSSIIGSLPNCRKGRQSMKAEEMRQNLCEYFNSDGQVQWQWNILI